MRRLRILFPRQIAAQIVALMVIAVILFNIAMSFSFGFIDRFTRPQRSAGEIQANARFGLAEASPRTYSVALGPAEAGPAPRRGPPPGFRGPPGPGGPGGPDGPGGPADFMFALAPIMASVLFLSSSLGLLGFWAFRSLIMPLRSFARAAERYNAVGDSITLEERGPAEMRTLAVALNSMQARISKLVGERTRMLAAVGHDLRTPITRLRLRVEFIEDEVERRRLLTDIDHMEALVQGALMYLREGSSGEKAVAIDLPSLLQTVADQFSDMGTDVLYDGPERMSVCVRPHEIQRLVTNLVENAVRYGRDPHIELARSSAGGVVIRVLDLGPGIPEGQHEAMFEAFVRGEAARTMNDLDGFGLGLGIARAIAKGHGGRLDLAPRTPIGLIATLELPPAVLTQGDAKAAEGTTPAE